ncbi:unnamed protein product [Adineta ricciae]|uniref:Uncharacterized protein n=1 Tax=Adineta ricciae TaxID=249248 RepID=A0A815TI08_ADIRI|nr:unnamed protein product [Adineta ricciae]
MNSTSFQQNIVYPIPDSDIPTIQAKVETVYKTNIEPYILGVGEHIQENLREIQTMIYIIDHYGEHNKEIDPVVLDALFQQVANSIEKLGIPTDVCMKLLEDLKEFAVIETSARHGKSFADYDLKYFYHKKSADVRMHRHFIRYLNGEKPESTEHEVIQDILEDIYDDFEDLEEDKNAMFNGNRLLSVIREHDVKKLKEYILFTEPYLVSHPEIAMKVIDGIKNLLENNAHNVTD